MGDGTFAGIAVVLTPAGGFSPPTIATYATTPSGQQLNVTNPARTTYRPVLAAAFNVSSDSAVKTKPTAAPDALSIITDAPAQHWLYLTDEHDVKRIGPMADDLPKWLVDLSPADALGGEHKTVDLARMVWVLWRAVEQLSEDLAALRRPARTGVAQDDGALPRPWSRPAP